MKKFSKYPVSIHPPPLDSLNNSSGLIDGHKKEINKDMVNVEESTVDVVEDVTCDI